MAEGRILGPRPFESESIALATQPQLLQVSLDRRNNILLVDSSNRYDIVIQVLLVFLLERWSIMYVFNLHQLSEHNSLLIYCQYDTLSNQ